MLLLGGDLWEAPHLSEALLALSNQFKGPIVAVLGNHDFYRGSIRTIRNELRELKKERSNLKVLEPEVDGSPLVLPGRTAEEEAWLCGTGGWGDCRAGTGNAQDFCPLNDERCIQELAQADREGQLEKTLRKLGEESARHLATQFEAIPQNARQIIVLCHVPPFPEAAWHRGARSEPGALNRFCCEALGKVIKEESQRRQHAALLVLCGHTHSPGYYKEGNLTCHTAGSQYRKVQASGWLIRDNKGLWVCQERVDKVVEEHPELNSPEIK